MSIIKATNGLEKVLLVYKELFKKSNEAWKPINLKKQLPKTYIIDYFVEEIEHFHSKTNRFNNYYNKELYTVTYLSHEIINNLDSNLSKYIILLELNRAASAFDCDIDSRDSKRNAGYLFSQCIIGYLTRLEFSLIEDCETDISSILEVFMHSLIKSSNKDESILKDIFSYCFDREIDAATARKCLSNAFSVDENFISRLEKAERINDFIKISSESIKEFDKTFYEYSKKPSKPDDSASNAQFFLLENLGSSFCARRPVRSYAGNKKTWRFPVHLTDPKLGDIGYVGEIIVDKEKNEIITNTPIDEMRKNAMKAYKKFKNE